MKYVKVIYKESGKKRQFTAHIQPRGKSSIENEIRRLLNENNHWNSEIVSIEETSSFRASREGVGNPRRYAK